MDHRAAGDTSKEREVRRVIVCTECGRHNEDGDDFCGECGAFLEFSGERTAADPDPTTEEEEAEEAARRGLVERVKVAVLGEEEGTDDGIEAGGRSDPGEVSTVAETEVVGDADAVEDDGATEVRRRAEEEAQRRSTEAAREAELARLAAEQAEREAEEERRRADEAEARRAREAAEAAEAAERAETQARAEAEARDAAARAAEQEAAEARAREEARAQEEAEGERQAREAAERADEERRAREAAARAEEERQARETAEREAAERAEAERLAREEAEAARRAADERAKAAELARQEAERQAQEAERAARMAALVAKPRPPDPTPAPPSELPSDETEAEASGRAATKRAKAAPADGTDEPTAPTTRRPEAVKPQKQRQKRTPAPTGTAEVINPGDLICGSCGAGNDPERRFCRRCGSSLVEAEVMPKPPWYRRLFRRRSKPQAVAGTRPTAKQRTRGLKSRAQYAVSGTKSRIGKIGRILAILGVLGIAGLSLGPLRSEASDLFDRVKRVISPEYEPVRPAEARATSELPGHPAMFVIDQIRNSYWAEGAEVDGVGEGLTLVFPEPTDIDRIGFLNGASETPGDFVTQPRIRDLQLLFDDGTTHRLTLADEADFQQFGVEARDVTTVQIQILSVYPSLEGSAASLAEVELFRKE